MQNIRNHLKNIFWLLIFTGLAVGLWQGSQPHLFHTAISPRKVYRIEYYEASYLQSLVHHEFKMPGFARLYRIQPETLLGESNVADLWMNGELYWWLNPPVNAVQVGRDIVFENVPPEWEPLTTRAGRRPQPSRADFSALNAQ